MSLLSRLTYFITLLYILSGCNLLQISQESKRLDNVNVLEGFVTNAAAESGQLYALLLKYSEGMPVVVGKLPVEGNNKYRFYTEGGVYAVGAFLDLNADGIYQDSEPANYLQFPDASPSLYKLDTKVVQKLPDLIVETAINRESKMKLEVKLGNSISNIGLIVGLDDGVFSSENANTGLWRPLEFLDKFGAGIYQLEPFQADKIPVIYIHGIKGSPTEFRHLIDELDRDRFQPWVLNYPSGVPLDMVSDYLIYGLNQMQDNLGFKEIYIVAHSMGGLMVRSFVAKHQDIKRPYSLGMVMTINSPMLGISSAAKGIKSSPIILPVWRDIAAGSDYIRSVHSWTWPESTPYHLVFSYKEGNDGDGVVPMNSQLSRKLQQEATQVHGFSGDHIFVLKASAFIDLVNQIMADPSTQN